MDIVVTGIGAKCALGENAEVIWESIARGKCGISPITRFDVSPFMSNLGAEVQSDDIYSCEKERLVSYGCSSAKEALSNASIDSPTQVAMVIGTCNGIIGEDIQEISKSIAEELGINGIVLTISTACASSTHAIGIGADLIRHGVADYVLAGGVDILTKNVFAGFNTLGILSDKPCAPFSTDMGTTLSEGSAFVFLEKEETARSRSVIPIAVYFGSGFSADAYHDTKPDPSGAGMGRAISAALTDANILPEEIDYYNAHGTATAANDASEWLAIQKTFKDRSKTLPVSSSKSFFGHAQGAAGVLEVCATLMAMNNNVVLPTLNLTKTRRNAPVDPVAAQKPRPHAVENVMCFNAGFGGANAALIFGKSIQKRQLESQTVNGIALEAVSHVSDPKDLENYLPRSELRTLDMSASLLASAIAQTLREAQIRFRSKNCAEIGLIVGQNHLSPDSVESFGNSVKERGWRNVSAMSFTRMVVNYTAGASCRLFGLKGPTLTLACEPDSGLAALVLNLCQLSHHSNCKQMIAAAVDDPKKGDSYVQQASAVLLSTKPSDSKVRLTSWAIKNNLESALEEVLSRTGYSRDQVELICTEEKGATAGLSSIVTAYNAIRKGDPGPFLVANANQGQAAVAVLIEKTK